MLNTKNIYKKYYNHSFKTSCYKTQDFRTFSRMFKNVLKQIDNCTIDNYSIGHFDVSGFLRNNDNNQLVYFSISDVRFFKNDWYNKVLIRTAKHNKDYTGGYNQFTTLYNIDRVFKQITEHIMFITID